MTQPMLMPAARIAQELNAKVPQVEAAIRLLDEGSTVPFIARYRKEATEGLTDTQLRVLADRIHYLRELDERRAFVLQAIRDQDKLTSELEQAIKAAETKTRLEDLYYPYRPKKRSKALIAKEAGLDALAMQLWRDPTLDPQLCAQPFVDAAKQIFDVSNALEGAQHILIEQISEDAELITKLRTHFWQSGMLKATAAQPSSKNHKFSDYYDYVEPIKRIPSHRALALFRGRREGMLRLVIALPEGLDEGKQQLIQHFNLTRPNQDLQLGSWLSDVIAVAWKTKLFPKLELESLAHLRELADEEAIKVFASNLRDLLLAAPAGHKVIMGLDPGIRTGVKVVVVDSTGKLLDYATVFPFAPSNEWHTAVATLAKLAAKHAVELISIGNGTASRETERLVADVIKMYPDLHLKKIVVSEAGASVYSASELASLEFPDLDVTLRGAVSIARRVQDPLAELVKIEPKSIGVGQYQHDVNQVRLAKSLDAVVEDCVNAVGVDVNTASAQLLTYVSGLNASLANNIVQYRNEHGPFKSREQLKSVPRMGEKKYQQAAGFLRIFSADNPLDASAVHPEAYPLVEKIIADKKIDLTQLIGNKALLRTIKPVDYQDECFGVPTIMDVLQELEKPGRDPRPEFKTAQFKEGIENVDDLQVGMILEGVVSNVTNFGAFVDVGVHQDGLVHISAMATRFINDPRKVVRTGDIITVKVIDVDKERKRIGLTLLIKEEKTATVKNVNNTTLPVKKAHTPKHKPSKKPEKKPRTHATKKTIFNTAMADALAKLTRDSK